MKKLLFAALLAWTGVSYAAEWHFPLYLDGGVPAANRIAVDITNKGTKPADGDIITVRGKGKFIYCGMECETKKGRLRCTAKIYK